MTSEPKFETGVYKHFKGGYYVATGLIRNASFTSKDDLFSVKYMSLETGEEWHRPLSEWDEIVERDDYKGPRFRRLVGEQDDEALLNAAGWIVECTSPLEIRNRNNGSFASGLAADIYLNYVKSPEFDWSDL